MRSRVRATQAPADDIATDRGAAKRSAGPGNQALARQLADGAAAVGGGVIQAKLTVGPAGDRYEREADAVADAVMTSPAADTQRQGPDEDELQMSRIQRQGAEEEELQMSRIQRQEGGEMEDEELQLSRIQRQGAEEEELQMSRIPGDEMGIGPEGGDLDSSTESAITAASGSGRSLDSSVRREMESSFGADFSSVRVHTGPESDGLNASMGARAFTQGSDVFVRSGDYAPGSPAGKHLLAHELTHVVQQGAAPARKVEEE